MRELGARGDQRFVLADEAAQLFGDRDEPRLDLGILRERRRLARERRAGDEKRASQCGNRLISRAPRSSAGSWL
jgi:hypothetical protein